jgi:glycogen synthase
VLKHTAFCCVHRSICERFRCCAQPITLLRRFGFFCGAANEYLRVRNVQPDILHCHDWQSAPVSWGERPNNAKVAFTIHNLNYGADLVGRAMATCEVATTVSPTYAREVGRLAVVHLG